MCFATKLDFSTNTFARRHVEADTEDEWAERNQNSRDSTTRPETALVLMWVPIAQRVPAPRNVAGPIPRRRAANVLVHVWTTGVSVNENPRLWLNWYSSLPV